ncbi:hypothetical protein AX14_003637 [Amanita brunnescens Koide BX004]|nr:hypothetical protein AX14_003637 [Amanita brunnescens Koide BX004]
MATPSREILSKIENSGVKSTRPLIPPQILQEDLPLTLQAAETVLQGRLAVQNILSGDDDRLIVVVGPCSVHNVEEAMEYAQLLKDLERQLVGKASLMIPILTGASKSTGDCGSHVRFSLT